MSDRGDWIQTAHGRQFWPIDPRPDEIFIDDIAHALSMQCRFGGHCLHFYSVAEHSVLMSRAASQENKLWALLHDAAEAYLVDVPRPLKPFLSGYREAEDKIMLAVCERFGLPSEMPYSVKELDNRILLDEQAQNMAAPPVPWTHYADSAIGVNLMFWRPSDARRAFLSDFEDLYGLHNGGLSK
jgi:hypothetical protein